MSLLVLLPSLLFLLICSSSCISPCCCCSCRIVIHRLFLLLFCCLCVCVFYSLLLLFLLLLLFILLLCSWLQGKKIRSLTKFVAELEQVYCQSPEIRGDHFKPGTCIIRLSPFVRLMCLTVCHSQQSDVQRTGAVKSRKKIRWFSSILIRLHHYLILLTSTFESHGLRSRRAHLHVVGKLWFMFFT